MKYCTGLILVMLLFSACSTRRITKMKDQVYDQENSLKLDVFSPRNDKGPKKILVFVHGGSWVNGKKSLYPFFGKGLARRGIVGVIISYRLSPRTDIAGMAGDVAKSIKWVKDNAKMFNGDTLNIFVSGHSAGGHLAAMVATDDTYFKNLKMKNPVKGTILIDAYGLNVYKFLKASNNPADSKYYPIFSSEEANWKKYSPINHLDKSSPPFIQFVGGKTNQIIKDMNADFYEGIKNYQPNAEFIVVKRKRHVPMMFQFYNPFNRTYNKVEEFISTN